MIHYAAKFWIVWNPAGKNPKFRHTSEDSAKAEAARLATENPGVKFIVLESKRDYVFQGIKETEHKEFDGLPF